MDSPEGRMPAPSPAPLVVILDGGFGSYHTERKVLEPLGATLAERSCRGDRDMIHAGTARPRSKPAGRLSCESGA